MNIEHKILHQKFVRFGANAKEWMKKCVLLLPEIEKHRIWEQKRFGSIYEYAAKLAGMSRNTVDDALRILRKIEDKPALRKIIEIKGINAVRPLVTIATKQTESFWAKKAMQMSRHTLEVYIKELAREGNLKGVIEKIPRTGTENNDENPQQQAILFLGTLSETDTDSSASGESNNLANLGKDASADTASGTTSEAPRKIIAMDLDPEVVEQLEKLKGHGSWNDLIKHFLQIRTALLEAKKPQPATTQSRHIPAKIQHYIATRTNGTCAFPGCANSSKIAHHTQRFALEKTHDPNRIYTLCKPHEQLAHHGLIENEEDRPSVWKIKKEPDTDAPKFKIDAMVGKYRYAYRSG